MYIEIIYSGTVFINLLIFLQYFHILKILIGQLFPIELHYEKNINKKKKK